MDQEKQIIEYIRANREIYSYEAINKQLKEKGFTAPQIKGAWETLGYRNQSSGSQGDLSRPNSLTQGSFWLTLILFMLGVPFISGLLDGLSTDKAHGGYFGFTNVSIVIGIITLIVAFFAGLFLAIPDRKLWQHAMGVALIAAPLLTLVFLFVPPFILYGVCTVGVRLGQGG